jgi:CTP synthase
VQATGAQTKYVIVTGGVLSGLGKGITTSSIGRLLIAHGLKVTAVKMDPYLNIDAGTMNPFEHGEVYVLDDGGEVDLDLGNYERYFDIQLGRDNNITTGKAYRTVIEKERRGDFLGKTVQIIPHVTNEIKEWIKRVGQKAKADVVLVEVGGTVGDIESMPFLEAVRQLHREVGHANLLLVHTTLVPVVGSVGEQKTKPTQHSVKELKAIGLHPDAIVCRAQNPVADDVKEKISLFCDVPVDGVFSAHDCPTPYEVPLLLHGQGITTFLLKRLELDAKATEGHLQQWAEFVESIKAPADNVQVAIVGKYTHLADSYLSITESFRHAGALEKTKVKIVWVDAEELEKGNESALRILAESNGILIPGGFGHRGAEGKIKAAGFARTQKIPYLGICYGFQLALVEFARSVLKLPKANTTENDRSTPDPVITLLPEQYKVMNLGGTMRLGGSRISVKPKTIAHALYGKTEITERHRHRFELNPEYITRFEKGGIIFSGRMADQPLMEIAELPQDVHPYFIGGQFHPEFLSRPGRPAPLFHGFVKAMIADKARRESHGTVRVGAKSA